MTSPNLAQQFVRFAINCQVLKFGNFTTKAGRSSPYFFNAGLFNSGATLGQLASFYAQAILAADIKFDMLFGPAYKGIPLVAAISIELARLGYDFPFAYNRKEAKDHGEGGVLVGAKLDGRVLIVDDVMSAGTAIKESLALINRAGATTAAIAVAIDRQEKAKDLNGNDLDYSAVQYISRNFAPVISIANLDDILAFLKNSSDQSLISHLDAIAAYRLRYGVNNR